MPPAQSNPCGTFFSTVCGDDPTFSEHLYWLIGHAELWSGVLIGLALLGLAIVLTHMRGAGRVLPLSLPALWTFGFVLVSAAVGVMGLLPAYAGGGSVLHDTYYVVAHAHYALSLSAWFAIFAAWYHWFPRLSGRAYWELWGRLHFWATFIGAGLLVVSLNLPALAAMRRRFADLPETFVFWNSVAWAGSCLAAIGTVSSLSRSPMAASRP